MLRLVVPALRIGSWVALAAGLGLGIRGWLGLGGGAPPCLGLLSSALHSGGLRRLGSSGTELHPGILAIIHRTMVTMLAPTPPAMALVAVMDVPFLLIDVLL